MFKRIFMKVGLFIIGIFLVLPSFSQVKKIKLKNMQKIVTVPPVCKKQKKELSIHGDTRIDDYYWLNERENPEVIKYLEDENKYASVILDHTKTFQGNLYREIVGRIKQTDQSVPYKDNGYFYMTRYEEGKEYPVYSRKKDNLDAPEEIMLDVNVLAEPFEFYRIAGRSVSPDNKILCYGQDTLSRRIYTLRFKNLETGELYPDKIENTTGNATWANDNKTVFYTRKDETLRAYKIFRHELGTPIENDVEVYHEGDETFSCYVFKSKSKKYITIASFQTLSSEYRFLNADDPTGTFEVFQPRERNHEYDVAHFEDRFYIRTNMGAKNFRLMVAKEGQTGKEHWTEVIPNRDDVLLEGLDVFKNYLVLTERINGIKELRIRPWNGDPEHYIAFEEDAHLVSSSTNRDFDTEVLRFGYSSMTTPYSTFDYNMRTKERSLLKEQEVVGDFDKDNYTSERHLVTVRDGAKVPISVVYRKGIKKDGNNPLLLYGYGSYGNSLDPYFSSVRLSLLDRGFVYVIAHIRGGEEMGRHWYEDGKLLKKKNTFYDFIDCAEFVIQEKYTNKEKLFAMGGSAGGLLMGAVVNMRPDLWKGVVAAVPFVDVVTTMLDESIPLTTGEFDEWGNPKDEKYYHYIKSYSPYDQVEKKSYPNMLVTTGLHDSQVQYWEPAKWVAKLREMKTDENILLLHTNMGAGHGGASGRFARFKETAMEYAFLLDLSGIQK